MQGCAIFRPSRASIVLQKYDAGRVSELRPSRSIASAHSPLTKMRRHKTLY
jgi:hypothetical protein